MNVTFQQFVEGIKRWSAIRREVDAGELLEIEITHGSSFIETADVGGKDDEERSVED